MEDAGPHQPWRVPCRPPGRSEVGGLGAVASASHRIAGKQPRVRCSLWKRKVPIAGAEPHLQTDVRRGGERCASITFAMGGVGEAAGRRNFTGMLTGPRYVDAVALGLISTRSLSQYRRAAGAFVVFLDDEHYQPITADEFDDLIVEYAVSRAVTASHLRLLIAAVEFVDPRFRGNLAWSRRRLEAMCRALPVQHTAPAGRELSALIGAQLAAMGKGRMGFGFFFQSAVGLRLGELIQVRPCGISRSPERNKEHLAIIRLGPRAGTKAGREQFTILDVTEHGELWRLLSRLMDLTPSDERLFPYSLSSCNVWLKKAQQELHLEDLGLTAHSPRAGFASDLIAAGASFQTIKERGRWIADSSLRVCIDVVGALVSAQRLRLQGLGEAIEFVLEHLGAYFNEATLDAYGVGCERAAAAGRTAAPRQAAPGRHPAAAAAGGRGAALGARGRAGGRGRSGRGGASGR